MEFFEEVHFERNSYKLHFFPIITENAFALIALGNYITSYFDRKYYTAWITR